MPVAGETLDELSAPLVHTNFPEKKAKGPFWAGSSDIFYFSPFLREEGRGVRGERGISLKSEEKGGEKGGGGGGG